MFCAQTNNIGDGVTAVFRLRHYMVVMVDGFITEQAMVFLHFRNGSLKAFLLVERSLLILPLLNVWIIKLHERKLVDFKHNIADRKELLDFLYQVDVRLE